MPGAARRVVQRYVCEAMKTREDFDEDMQVLWHIMEKGAKNNKKSVDVMLVKIREINNGTFIGRLFDLCATTQGKTASVGKRKLQCFSCLSV